MSSPPTTPVQKPIPIQSATHAAVQDSPPPRRIRRWHSWLVGILALLLIAGLYWQATYVSGIELNSQTWDQRGFSLRRDPLTGLQITGVQHNPPRRLSWWTTAPNRHAKTLPIAISQYLRKQHRLPPRWDLVRLDGSSEPGGAASILVELLDAHNRHYAPFWPQWSTDHPSRAALVWPAAQTLVESEHYALLPALLDLALQDNSSSQLEKAIGQLVQTTSIASEPS